MGGLFSKKPAQEQKPSKKQDAPANAPISNGAAKDRVNDTDRAILDVKARQRKIRTY